MFRSIIEKCVFTQALISKSRIKVRVHSMRTVGQNQKAVSRGRRWPEELHFCVRTTRQTQEIRKQTSIVDIERIDQTRWLELLENKWYNDPSREGIRQHVFARRSTEKTDSSLGGMKFFPHYLLRHSAAGLTDEDFSWHDAKKKRIGLKMLESSFIKRWN